MTKIKAEHLSGAVTGNIIFPSKGKTFEKTVMEDVEYDVYGLPDSYFSKASARVFDDIDNGKAGVLTPSKFVELIEKLGKGFHDEDLVGHMWKVDPNESGSLNVLPL